MKTKTPSVVVVGGGLAGLAATVALAPRGFQVTLLESRPRLGGRASSFTDPATGQLIDACQHVAMGCCTNLAHLLRTVGSGRFLAQQPTLYFMTPDRRVSQFKADPWPAPFHLGRALLGAHYLTVHEKLQVVYGLAQLLRESPDADPPLLPWLQKHWQTPRVIARFWSIVLTSALNESIDNVGLKYARKVFLDGFIRHRDGFLVEVPTVPLGRLYGEELRGWLDRHSVTVRCSTGVKQLNVSDGANPQLQGLKLRDDTTISADHVILAVPFERVLDLVPEPWQKDPAFAGIPHLTSSPITSVHFWFDRPVLELPHVVLIDSLGQWVFQRKEVAPGEYYLQVVVSASRELRSQGGAEIQRLIHAELARLFPGVSRAQLLRARVVTEHTATFSAVPGIDRWRPTSNTSIPNVYLAGDWTQTGWPATMEGAVRSGYRAAEALLAGMGRRESLVQPDLGG